MFTDDLYPHIDELEAHFAQARTLGTGQLVARAHRARSLAFRSSVVRFRHRLIGVGRRARAAYYGALNQSTCEAPRSI